MRSVAPVALVLAAAAFSGCLNAAGLLDDEATHLPTALLRADPFPHLVVEIDHVPGAAPCASAVAAFLDVLEAVAEKASIRVHGPNLMPAGDADYTNGELVAIHRANADAPGANDGQTAYLHVLYLNGLPEAQAGGHAAGRTLHDHGTLFVFKDTFRGVHRLDGHARRDATCDVERAVLLHELGHAFGLVNRGIPMLHDRESPDHAGHSTNPGSVMYPTLHLGHDGLLLREPPRNFDAYDYEDLRAFQASRLRSR